MTMSKHLSVAISGSDLLERVYGDSDTPWRDVIGWNCAELDSLESLANPTDEQAERMSELDQQQRQIVAGKWWIVSWPDHVTKPGYNSDANYSHSDSEAEAIREAESVYS